MATKSGDALQSFHALLSGRSGHARSRSGPLPAPKENRAPARWPKSLRIDKLELLPKIRWDAGIHKAWQPGEAAASDRAEQFVDGALADYLAPAIGPTSTARRGSARACISARSARGGYGTACGKRRGDNESKAFRQAAEGFSRQLAWREFAYQLLYHFPHTAAEPLNPKFARFAWRKDRRSLRAWQAGRTGYPIVDAGMRQLWTTGWMHNRVRMIVGSFLVKDLLVPWHGGPLVLGHAGRCRSGQQHARLAMGGRLRSRCGALLPDIQSASRRAKSSIRGQYIRRWVPELAKLPTRWIHKPWLAPARGFAWAGVKFGRDYPRPIVDHGQARGGRSRPWRNCVVENSVCWQSFLRGSVSSAASPLCPPAGGESSEELGKWCTFRRRPRRSVEAAAGRLKPVPMAPFCGWVSDCYGRVAADVDAVDGGKKIWLQGEMLRTGLAFVYPALGDEPRFADLTKAEHEARAARGGGSGRMRPMPMCRRTRPKAARGISRS